ncbi:TPA: hypothetical protein L7V13_000658 [Klebsiella quasipneumoniae subsp. quasipneumoniae]|nr:hypothetical protein [Klebsiella quasipneumoniae subsp. quasipneumoniae]HBT4817160.1 hypothetical protein [Klebsiella quasipneumoniae subsp. quasipneumoniae]HCC2627101.1 hypothetical protein [Klebsiella quasipneumoniae]HDK5911767.1 hypothetical protein [Klebsiella quasipneumoniae]
MKITMIIYSIFLGSFSAQAFAGECDAILEQGVRNTYSDITQQALKSNISTNFCSSTLTNSKDSDEKHGGLSLNIGSFGLGGSGGGSREQYNKTKVDLCTSSSNQLNDDGYHRVLELIADPNIVEAWRSCINNRGLIINADVRDATQIDVAVKFLNVNRTYQATLTMPAQIIGMTCPNILDTGRVIDGNQIFFSCQRIGDQPVTININTDYMGGRLYIPKPQKVTIVTDDKKDISDVKKLNCESRLLPGGVIQMPDPGCPSGSPIIIPPPPPPSGTGR